MARIFITGSTDGLRRAAARTLLDDGHRVVLHARTAARAASVDDLALRAAGVVVGDLASAEETGRVADQVNAIGRMDAELAAGGFLDAVWVGRWDVVFAGFYVEALEAGLRGEPVSGPWAAAFAAADDPGGALPPLRHVLLGMNAHINFDLPQALLMLISDAEFGDPALLARRAADHCHIDRVLGALVDSRQRVPGLPGPAAGCGMRCSPGPTGWPPSGSSPRPGPRSGPMPACWPLRAGRARPPIGRGSRSWNGLPPLGSQILPRPVRCCCGPRPAASGSRCRPVPDPAGA